jgi:hypothetical protein|tara:strand:- start:112 stop:567 length:456 start_codon:yes stop_codon:yes gene_type:complete
MEPDLLVPGEQLQPQGIAPLVDEGMTLPDFKTIGGNVLKNIALNKIGEKIGLETLGSTMLGTSINPLIGISALTGRSGLISNYLQNKRMQKQIISDQRRNEIKQIQQRLDNQGSSTGDRGRNDGPGGANQSAPSTSSQGFDSSERGKALHG